MEQRTQDNKVMPYRTTTEQYQCTTIHSLTEPQ